MLDEVVFTIEGVSRISFSRPIQSVKETGESGDAFEQRTFRERVPVNAQGNVLIPTNAIKGCLQNCAKYLSESVPGKGKATYTKHFLAGVMECDEIQIELNGKPVQPSEMPFERLYVPSDGTPGGNKRVWRNFCYVPEGWRATASMYVLDPLLIDNPDKIEEYLGHAGKFIGLLRWRPRNGGLYGRFRVVNFKMNRAKAVA